jgi:formamidopyrimidine-DNA glycosylase
MKRERKLLTEKGLLKLIEKIKDGEDLESQYRVFRGYNVTVTRAYRSVAERQRWYYKRNPEAVETRNASQRKLRAFRRENELCLFCGAKARKKKGKTFIMCKKCHERRLKQLIERKQKK